jgi:long-chain acyl-CoA synthetase
MNIGRLAEDNIGRFGEYEFVCFNGRWHTNVAMNTAANRLGNALRKQGIKKGDRIGVQLLNGPELIQSFFAIFKIGAVLVPVNPALRADELAYLYDDAGMATLISSTDHIDRIRAAREKANHPKTIILTGKDIPKDTLSYDLIIEKEPSGLVTEDTDNDDVAVIIYTAGTTGSPKGVMLTHYNWYTHVSGYYEQVLLDTWGMTVKQSISERDARPGNMADREVEVFGVNRRRVSLIALPLFHGYGVFAVNLEFLTGGKLVVLDRWDTEKALKCIEKFKVSEFRGVPTMYIQQIGRAHV